MNNGSKRPLAISGGLSLIIPTRNEQTNVEPLLDRLSKAAPSGLREVIFVDDSDDNTPEVARRAGADAPFPVRVIHRPVDARDGGLGGAVVAGIEASEGEFFGVMDADLQHPPERIESLYQAAVAWPADIVIGSRYIAQGSAVGLSRTRRAISRAAGRLTRMLFPRRFSAVTDPMSGFFMVRRRAVDMSRVRGHGFKILLEIMAHHPDARRIEVPYAFSVRNSGTTKASFVEGLRFIKRLAQLRLTHVHHRFLYDIHGLITVDSDARLPELEAFRTHGIDEPTITVRVGLNRVARDGDFTEYREVFGRLGFATRLRRVDQHMQISVTNFLARSPHVLYTNVVEPVLRWAFVERGHALVHAAGLEVDGSAYFITAQTDTGKTTTMLKMLQGGDYRFLADDLTIIDREGGVLPYPKPLTISAHTLHAVERATLPWLQRLALPIQSRLHSRNGRRVGLALAETRMPAATMNAVVQFLIPPPKYHVTTLIPDSRIADGAKVAGLFLIERGPSASSWLEADHALGMLLDNCEDAYGFPPYQQIAPFLRNGELVDLADVEREIIADAFAGMPAQLFASNTLDWAERIPAAIPTAVPVTSAAVAS